MKELVLIAQIKPNKGKLEFLKEALIDLVLETRGEEGCLQYDLFVDQDDQEKFWLYELWDSSEAWENHMKTSHIKSFLDKTDGMMSVFEGNILQKII